MGVPLVWNQGAIESGPVSTTQKYTVKGGFTDE